LGRLGLPWLGWGVENDAKTLSAGILLLLPWVTFYGDLRKLMDDAEMLADVKAYDAAKARLEDGEDELIPLEITERRLEGETALGIWREHRKLTQERLAKKSKVSRALVAASETNRKTGSVNTWKKLGAALGVSWEQLT
jgi:DNA-binding XRE family transcriptional regulator